MPSLFCWQNVKLPFNSVQLYAGLSTTNNANLHHAWDVEGTCCLLGVPGTLRTVQRRTPLLKGGKAKMVNVSRCPTYGPWHIRSEGPRLCRYWLIILQTTTRTALHKPTGHNTCGPQTGWTRTPPYSETTPLLIATCPWQGQVAEDQRDGLIAAVAHIILYIYTEQQKKRCDFKSRVLHVSFSGNAV